MSKEQKVVRSRDFVEEWELFCEGKLCGFCYRSEQGKHGEVRKEWLREFWMMVPVCRKHSFSEESENGTEGKSNQAV
jgi:hypothetical protein